MVARQDYNELSITLSSNEELGILDPGYLADAFGVDGQLTVHSLDTGSDIAVPMAESFSTELAPHEVFVGYCAFALLPNGAYELRGAVRDVFGNIRLLAQPFDITSEDISVTVSWLHLTGVHALSFPFAVPPALAIRAQPRPELRIPIVQQSVKMGAPQLSLIVPFRR